MNVVILIGRLTKDPEIRINDREDGSSQTVAKYTLAVPRWNGKNQGENQTDFIRCTAFGKAADFAEKYLTRGTKICVKGRIYTDSYTNKEGNKVFSTEVIVDTQEFAGEKRDAPEGKIPAAPVDADGFMNVPPEVDEEELPFR